MTVDEIKKISDDIEFLEDGLDTVIKFKENIKHMTTLCIEGTWFAKKRNKNKYNKMSCTFSGQTEIKFIKQFFTIQEKYLLEQYNSKIEKLQEAGIEIKNKYQK